MGKHTPGPWEVRYDAMVFCGNRSIASCGGYSSNVNSQAIRLENEANARLIAAAPKMYAFIQSVADNFVEARILLAEIDSEASDEA